MKSEPWARLMMPMTPKISVSPLAMRKSSRPYCTPLRSCASRPGKSMRCCPYPLSPFSRREGRGSASGQLAAGAGVGEVLDGDVDHLVLPAFGFAQIDVLRD